MKERRDQSVLLRFIFRILVFYCFLFGNQASSEELLEVTSNAQYIIHFLSTTQSQDILVQQCCQPGEVLSIRDGHCVPIPTDFEDSATLALEKRFKRAIQNNTIYSVENDTADLDQNAFSFKFKFERPVCKNGSVRKVSYENAAIQFTSSLQLVTNIENRSLIVDTQGYCISSHTDSERGIVVELCVPNNVHDFFPVTKSQHDDKGHKSASTSTSFSLPSSPVLLRKCCPPFHVMDMASFACVRHDIPWLLYPISSIEELIIPFNTSLYQSIWNTDASTDIPAVMDSEKERISGPLQVSWLTGTPYCGDQDSYEVYIDRYDRYYVNSEGVLIIEQNGTVSKAPPTEFCIDAVIFDQIKWNDEDYSYNSTYSSEELNSSTYSNEMMDEKQASVFSRQVALVCYESIIVKENNNSKFTRRTLYAILTGISSIFLLITCLVYTLLRKELKLPGWLQFAYSVALLLTFFMLTVAQLWTQAIHDISKSLCRALGYGLHFSWLVCFFYLTSMNWDTFSSFRSIALAHGFGKGGGKRRFLEYSAFSIGFPAAIIVLLLVVDSCDPADNTNLQGSFCILPTTGIGVESCVFDSKHKAAQLHYFYGFVGILLMINLVIFVCTLVSLRNRERETRMAKRQSTSPCDYDRLQLFTRLFLIMGILWIFEVISWVFQYFDVDEKVQDVFIVTDCLNASQGFAVFLMFVCKRQTWKQLKKKFKASCCGIRGNRPLCRPNGTISSSNNTNGTSVKSSHLSSTKSRDSTRLPSASTATMVVGMVENGDPLKPET